MRPGTAGTVAIAAIWGALVAWIFWWLFDRFSGAMLIASAPAVSGAVSGGWATADQLRPLLLGVVTLVPALLCGLLFGLPLGVILPNSGLMLVSWLSFVGAFLVTMVARMLFEQMVVSELLHNITHPIYWLTALSTLLFAFVGHRARSAYGRRRAA